VLLREVHLDDEAIFSAPISLVGGWGVFFDFPEVSDAFLLAKGEGQGEGAFFKLI